MRKFPGLAVAAMLLGASIVAMASASNNASSPAAWLPKGATPAGANWGHFYDPEIETLVGQILNEFDADKRLAMLIKLHELESDRAQMIWVVHDLNPRALSPKLHGFVQAQNWFQDLTPITVEP